jgi:hypothetical protein
LPEISGKKYPRMFSHLRGAGRSLLKNKIEGGSENVKKISKGCLLIKTFPTLLKKYPKILRDCPFKQA